MGLITSSRSSKVITSSESVGRATVIQPGNRTWSTVIECINASGWALPPFVILEGKVHLQYWYQQQGLPRQLNAHLRHKHEKGGSDIKQSEKESRGRPGIKH
jgi:hypothetical protein